MNFKRLIKANALERTVLIMYFISVSLSSWYLPYCEEITDYEKAIMMGAFNYTLSYGHPDSSDVPWDGWLCHGRSKKTVYLCQDILANWENQQVL